MINKTFSWIILTFIVCVFCDTELNGPCKVQRLDGICQPITMCKFAMTILSINDVQTLRSMFCGFEGSLPKVCCPIASKYNKSTPMRRVRTTTPQYEYENEVVTAASRPPTPPQPTIDPFALPGRDVCGQITNLDKIVGGEIAAIDEFPWLARIKFFKPSIRQEIYACTGSLISDRYVLTAAHCLTVYKVISVRLGEWDTETDVDCQNEDCNHGPVDVKVENTIIYPGFNKLDINSGDIALLRLEHHVKFTDFVRPVCLPTTEYVARQDYIDSTYTTAGWGKTEFGEPSVILRKVNLNAVPYSICVSTLSTLPKTEDPNVICAGGKRGRDSCQGDSGGPLLRIVGEDYVQNWYVYGVTSYGATNCGTAGKPAVYTRVSKYMDWILENVGKG